VCHGLQKETGKRCYKTGAECYPGATSPSFIAPTTLSQKPESATNPIVIMEKAF